MTDKLFLKNIPLEHPDRKVSGEYVVLREEPFYKISNCDRLRPFFMSIVSNTDHWMFISSNGGITAGRKNSDHALFPYYTDDKLSDLAHVTGSKTIVHILQDDKRHLWEPFSDYYPGVYAVERNIYKNYCGNKILFEEVNHDLGLTFQYSWNLGEKFGFVKKASVFNHNSSSVSISILDGIQNILPSGVGEQLQHLRSNLVDAYKKNELDPHSGLGIFTLSAVIVDRPIPSESLCANLVYTIGPKSKSRLVCSAQLEHFRNTGTIIPEYDIRAERGAYFTLIQKELAIHQSFDWMIVADVDQDQSDMVRIINLLKQPEKLRASVERDLSEGTENLSRLVAKADGLQISGQLIGSNRHFANVLFNIMRGGIPAQEYQVPVEDYKEYLALFNVELFERHKSYIESLPSSFSYMDLQNWASHTKDRDLIRLSLEYLPLIFSRRHGDPSRPWNRFSIDLFNDHGDQAYNYEGNWRDIFQNWEALALSYPHLIEGMIAKFLNASTADGYNPYRITKEGIDWEVIEADDPWSFIGYWGDHQVIYLQKLLEVYSDHLPDRLENTLTSEIFSYANVPYRIKSYQEILENPRDTIDFDNEKAKLIQERVRTIGMDGKMLYNADGKVHKVNLVEKLLTMILTKFSNFIPDAGIWLNTQRPEWNDANNALVGYGVSMVTLEYMYRSLKFIREIFQRKVGSSFIINPALKKFLADITKTLHAHKDSLGKPFSNEIRRSIMDELGKSGEDYREAVYSGRITIDQENVKASKILDFIDVSLKYLAQTISVNERNDGLFHSYNLVNLSESKTASINRLYEMLEGQVSLLSARILNVQEVLDVLKALKDSRLWREDQYTYLLYPDKALPRFEQKNDIPVEQIERSKLLQQLVHDKNTEIIYTDENGECHFNTSFHNADLLKVALDQLSTTDYGHLVNEESQLILDIYESIFDHQSFTGRSGTFFGYEGLGSVYWHMVSKLRLAVIENYYWAKEQGAKKEDLKKLKAYYYDIEKGIGNNKSPEEYGAFPMDPYSHTPAHKGAQQPGMTGQVKEDIISRFGELGIQIKGGSIIFHPSLLRKEDWLQDDGIFEYFDLENQKKTVPLKKQNLAFTYCSTPIIYGKANSNQTHIHYAGGKSEVLSELTLEPKLAKHIFDRSGVIEKIVVSFDSSSLE